MDRSLDASDTYAPGSTISASLAPQAVADFDPAVRRMLATSRHFTKCADGSWRPCGCQLGLARCFDYGDLRQPRPRA